MEKGKLYLCATPIGNLEDITYRVVRILNEVDLIAAEDTRHSIKLLNHFEIKTPMTSYHEFNKYDKAAPAKVQKEVKNGLFINCVNCDSSLDSCILCEDCSSGRGLRC